MEDLRTAAARRHFDSWSATYEHDRASRWLRQAQSAALQQLELESTDRLLDLGCATGAAVRAAAGQVRRAVGFDLSPAMIARARTLAAGLANVEFAEGDVAGPLPFADGAFTAVLCTTAFHHFTRPAQTIGELARVLAAGGRLVIGDGNRDQPVVRLADLLLRAVQQSHVGLPSAARLAGDLRAAGFAGTRVRTMWRGCYALVRAEKPG